MSAPNPWPLPAALLTWTLMALASPGTARGGTVAPILHYRMEGEPGTEATVVVDDANGNDCFPWGFPRPQPEYVLEDPGCGDTSLTFSGGVITPQNPVPQLATLAGDLTVEALIMSTQPVSSPQQFIVSNWRLPPSGPGYQFALEIRADGRPQVTFSDGIAGHIDQVAAPDPIAPGVWYHLAGVRDGGSNQVRLYVGGSLVASASLNWGLSPDNELFAIGARGHGELFFYGSIAEVRLTDAALDPEDFLYPCAAVGVPGTGSATVSLTPASPNPFRHTTTITYANGPAGQVAVTVHDVRGRLVATLRDRFEASGSHGTVRWDGTDDFGRPVGSGVYFCRIAAGPEARTERLTLVR